MRLEQLFENENRLITPTKFKNYYLELCPEEYEIQSIWGPKSVTNAVSDIDGYKNTVQMYLHGNELAEKVLNLNINGKDDWYIPAKSELIFFHIPTNNLSSEFNQRKYWTSTERDAGTSYMQGKTLTEIYTDYKSESKYVRPVRRVYG